MRATSKANKLADAALGGFRKAHAQLGKANDLHAQARAQHTETARDLDLQARLHRSAADTALQAIVDNDAVRAKLSDLVGGI